MKSSQYDVGVVVGRFQVGALTAAQMDILSQVAKMHKRFVIMVGVSPTLVTRKNPLDYVTRMVMLKSAFPEAIISHISDQRTDEGWSQALDGALRALIPIGSICLYGGRDSFINAYRGSFPTKEIASIHYEDSGTQARDKIRVAVTDSLQFREGIIYAAQNQFPKVFPTIDVAVTRSHMGGGKEVLLGRKESASNKYSFPGGFVDPTDASYEAAAIREVSEEIDAEIDRELSYISSVRIDDWRYPHSEKIITVFFEAKYRFGSAKPKEEFCETKWFQIDSSLIQVISETHLSLAEALLRKHEKI